MFRIYNDLYLSINKPLYSHGLSDQNWTHVSVTYLNEDRVLTANSCELLYILIDNDNIFLTSNALAGILNERYKLVFFEDFITANAVKIRIHRLCNELGYSLGDPLCPILSDKRLGYKYLPRNTSSRAVAHADVHMIVTRDCRELYFNTTLGRVNGNDILANSNAHWEFVCMERHYTYILKALSTCNYTWSVSEIAKALSLNTDCTWNTHISRMIGNINRRYQKVTGKDKDIIIRMFPATYKYNSKMVDRSCGKYA